ncbi:MAG: phytanoyl-CoA dioxygenase family protein [Planctomycetota bacterium]
MAHERLLAAIPVEPTWEEREEARALPLTTRFTLGPRITGVQQAFLDEHGFLVFAQVATTQELEAMEQGIRDVERRWLAEGRTSVYGTPLFVGEDPEGNPFIQRFAFSSCFSPEIRAFVRNERLIPVRSLVGFGTRVGDVERDGVVFNRNLNVPGSVYTGVAWHTDALRDVFYLRNPTQQLNVGLHFDRIKKEDGGLRLLPGTHRQGLWGMCTRMPHFVSQKDIPEEIAVETEPGDLTVHDGRMWHRVVPSPHMGWRSLRRSMYVPYLKDEYTPKSEDSRTPAYHHLFVRVRKLQGKLTKLASKLGR